MRVDVAALGGAVERVRALLGPDRVPLRLEAVEGGAVGRAGRRHGASLGRLTTLAPRDRSRLPRRRAGPGRDLGVRPGHPARRLPARAARHHRARRRATTPTRSRSARTSCRRPRLGPAQVHLDVLRDGPIGEHGARRAGAGRAHLPRHGRHGRSARGARPARVRRRRPARRCRRSSSACATSRQEGEPRNGITEQLDLRLDPAAAGWLSEPSGRAEVRGWVRYASGADAGPLQLLCLADALPPVTFALGLRGWVPTVELTVHVRARPAPGLAAGGAAGAAAAGRLARRDVRDLGQHGPASSRRATSSRATAGDPPRARPVLVDRRQAARRLPAAADGAARAGRGAPAPDDGQRDVRRLAGPRARRAVRRAAAHRAAGRLLAAAPDPGRQRPRRRHAHVDAVDAGRPRVLVLPRRQPAADGRAGGLPAHAGAGPRRTPGRPAVARRPAHGPVDRGMGHRRAGGSRPRAGLGAVARRPRRGPRGPAGVRRRAAAGHLRPGADRLGADRGADRAPARACRRPAGCAPSRRPRCCRTGGSTRTASCGTARTGSSRRPTSWRATGCPPDPRGLRRARRSRWRSGRGADPARTRPQPPRPDPAQATAGGAIRSWCGPGAQTSSATTT